jgi:hypothetical protein
MIDERAKTTNDGRRTRESMRGRRSSLAGRRSRKWCHSRLSRIRRRGRIYHQEHGDARPARKKFSVERGDIMAESDDFILECNDSKARRYDSIVEHTRTNGRNMVFTPCRAAVND